MSGYIGNIPVPQATQTRDNFTASSGQTTFNTSGYTPNYLDVYLNGVHLDPSDYTATNGTDVILGTGATAGDVLEVVAFTTFTPANLQSDKLVDSGGTTRVQTGTSGDVEFYEDTGTTAKFFWDASAENLSIGDVSGDYVKTDYNVDTPRISFGQGGSWAAEISHRGASSPGRQNVTELSSNTDPIAFRTNGAERMRIDAAGSVLFGTTSEANLPGSGTSNADGVGVSSNGVFRAGRSDYVMQVGVTSTGTGKRVMQIFQTGTNCGSITVSNSTSTSYNTSSDYRLKTDVQPMTGATERLKALKPVNFEWISSGERVDGFLAHEAQEVVPEAVTGTKDAMRTEEYEVTPAVLDDDGNVVTEAVMGEREVPDYQGIDQSKLVPLLVAAMQEQQTVIEDLKARIEVLEGASA